MRTFWFLLSPLSWTDLIFINLFFWLITTVVQGTTHFKIIYHKRLNVWTIGVMLPVDSLCISKANALTCNNERHCYTFFNYSLIFMFSNFKTAWITLESDGIWIQEMEHFMVLRLVNQHFNTALGWTRIKTQCRKTVFSNCVILLHRLILKSKMLLAGTTNVLLSNLTSNYPFDLI